MRMIGHLTMAARLIAGILWVLAFSSVAVRVNAAENSKERRPSLHSSQDPSGQVQINENIAGRTTQVQIMTSDGKVKAIVIIPEDNDDNYVLPPHYQQDEGALEKYPSYYDNGG